MLAHLLPILTTEGEGKERVARHCLEQPLSSTTARLPSPPHIPSRQEQYMNLPPELFEREDSEDDSLFYAVPRLCTHIDPAAIDAVRVLFQEALPVRGRILDLMSSWRSHLPEGQPGRHVVGLGMNRAEMEENPQLDEFVVHDLNRCPVLPFRDGEFDATICVVSIQYVVHPGKIFREVGRILRKGGPLVVVFSHRCFPTKAVRLWRMTGDLEHGKIVQTYFRDSECFGPVEVLDRSPSEPPGDPVYAVIGSRA